MRDAKCAESKEISILPFLLFELWSFLWRHHPNFRWIFTITLKTKIGKKNYFVFYFIQHIPHLIKNLTISEGGVCIYLVGTADLRKLRIFCGKFSCHFCSFILVNFLSISSTKSTISQKLKIEKLFSPRCKDFFPIKDMQTSPP